MLSILLSGISAQTLATDKLSGTLNVAISATKLGLPANWSNATEACNLLCGRNTSTQSEDGSRFRIDAKGSLWYWHPAVK